MNYWILWIVVGCLASVAECAFYKVKRLPCVGMISLTVICFQRFIPRILEPGRSFDSKNHLGMFLIVLFSFTWRLMSFDLENL